MSDLRLKCTKFDFGWGLPQTSLGSLQRSSRPPPLAGLRGTTSKGRGGQLGGGKGRDEGREELEKEKGRGWTHLSH